MFKKINFIVFGLLAAYLTLQFFREPSGADAIILVALTCLTGFSLNLYSKELPDIRVEVDEKYSDLIESMNKAFENRDQEINSLKNSVSGVELSKARNGEVFRF